LRGDDPGAELVLEMARAVLRDADPATRGLWPRVSALLGRQALEAGVRRLWARQGLDLRGCPMRAQLICLRTYLGDAALAARAAHAWSALSRGCHHHAYELAPTVTELQGWLQVVDDLVQRAAAR
jgi:hypothetical protein